MPDVIVGIEKDLKAKGIEAWANSIVNSNFQGRTVLFSYSPDSELKKLAQKTGLEFVEISPPSGEWRVNKERWRHYAAFTSSLESSSSFVILTDVRDLVFQRDPSTWLADRAAAYDVVASSEGETYEFEPWNRDHALRVYGPMFYEKWLCKQMVMNAGLVAGKPRGIAELCRMMWEQVQGPCPSDQVIYNAILRTAPPEWKILFSDHAMAWGIHGTVLGVPNLPKETRLRREKLRPKIVKRLMCNEAGEPYVVVHQYDRLPT
jgi:hypothetical protein